MTQQHYEARLAIQFAPICRTSDEFEGFADPKPCAVKVQSNRFLHVWRGDALLYSDIRAGFISSWCGLVGELTKHFDAVTALEMNYQCMIPAPMDYLRRHVAGIAEAAAKGASVNMRKSMPTLGTLSVTIAQTDPDVAMLMFGVVGHPGTPVVRELLQWLDSTNAVIHNTLAALIGSGRGADPRLSIRGGRLE